MITTAAKKELRADGFAVGSDDSAIAALKNAAAIGKLAAKAVRAGALVNWSDTPVGLKVDPIPNPKQWLVLGISPIAVSLDFGEPGFGPEH